MLRGKNVAITGAGGGIGQALVLAFLKEGADVFASDLNVEMLAPLTQKTEDHAGRLFTYTADVTNDDSLCEFRDSILKERGQIDCWVNNAGITYIAPFAGSDSETYQRVIDINLGGVIRGTRLALEAMQRRGIGSIVNIASMAGHVPSPYMTAYTTSKHGVVGFTRALQAELEMQNSSLHVMLVSPGFADTNILAKGDVHGFPEWLSFIVTPPQSVASDIVIGVKKKKLEIYPTLNGKILRRMYSLVPKSTVRGSKILFAKSFKDAVLNRLDIPGS